MVSAENIRVTDLTKANYCFIETIVLKSKELLQKMGGDKTQITCIYGDIARFNVA